MVALPKDSIWKQNCLIKLFWISGRVSAQFSVNFFTWCKAPESPLSRFGSKIIQIYSKYVLLKSCLLLSAIMNEEQLEDLSEVPEQASAAFFERTDQISSNHNLQHVEESYSCNLCARNFKNKRGLSQHIRSCRNKAQDNDLLTRTHGNGNTIENFIAASNSGLASEPTVDANDQSIPNHSNITQENVASLVHQAEESIELVWGNLSKNDLMQVINSAYEESVKWKRNLFLLPSGKIGKDYISECTRLIHEWVNESSLHLISIKALMLMPSLLLQKPSKNSKSKDHSNCLKRRLEMWKKGEFDQLLQEIRFIQSNLKQQQRSKSIEEVSKQFHKFMISGKVKAALKLLSETESKGIFPLTD